MPYNPNANWTAKTNAGAFSPVYYAVISGLASKHYSTAAVKAAGTTKKPFMNFPQTVGQKVSQLQGRTSVNLYSMELVGNGTEISDLFANEKTSPTLASLINRRVTIYSGYADLSETDYAIIAAGQIRGVEADDASSLWRFALGDVRRGQDETIFINADARGQRLELAFLSDTPDGVGVFKVTGDPTAWSQGDRIFLGPSTDGSNPGAEEKITIQQVRDITNEVFIDPPLTYKYKAGDPVRSASTLLVGNPYNVMLAVLTGDFANGSWPLVRAIGKPTGVGLSTSDIDTTGIILERDRVMPSDIWVFDQTRPVSGSRFLESLIYRWLGYPKILLDGRVSFRSFRPPLADDTTIGLATILEADVIDWTSGRDVDSHINRVLLGVDSDFGGGDPAQSVTTEDASDQTLTAEKPEIREETTALSGLYSGPRLAAGLEATFLRRFLDGPYQIGVRVHPRKRAIQIGEDISLTHSKIPNPASSTPGLTAKRLEVVERTENLSDGLITLVLQDANWVRPFIIAPDSVVAGYDAASSTEKEYGAIGIDGPTNFGDGGSPYEIV